MSSEMSYNASRHMKTNLPKAVLLQSFNVTSVPLRLSNDSELETPPETISSSDSADSVAFGFRVVLFVVVLFVVVLHLTSETNGLEE